MTGKRILKIGAAAGTGMKEIVGKELPVLCLVLENRIRQRKTRAMTTTRTLNGQNKGMVRKCKKL